MKIFPVFHTSLLRRKNPFDVGLVGQSFINKEESRNIRGQILERSDGEAEVEKWEFDDILDSHDELGPGNITYKVKWKHQEPTWQVATDLRGQDTAIMKFHHKYPEKPGPLKWVKQQKDKSTYHESGLSEPTDNQVDFTRSQRKVVLPKRYRE
ncbi:hypothetical protein K3495_g8310 [Podosphaera aphanis]|nr:hypothetical protein K3495_g8310 [Podosphaera aphanis]